MDKITGGNGRKISDALYSTPKPKQVLQAELDYCDKVLSYLGTRDPEYQKHVAFADNF